MAERGHRPYHARQVYDGSSSAGPRGSRGCRTCPKRLRRRARRASGRSSRPRSPCIDVAPDGTDKLLLECRDGRRIECVLMAEEDRRTVCISTQVGCGMGCVFCASGLKGVERNLTPGRDRRAGAPAPEPPARRARRLTNLVVMGMGESLANLDNLIAGARLDLLARGAGAGPAAGDDLDGRACPRRCGSWRRWTGSTTWRSRCTPRPRRCGTSWCRSTRRSGSARWWRRPTPTSGGAAGRLPSSTCCSGGSTTVPEDAAALADLLEARKAHVNLIPYNPVAGLPFERPTPEAVRRFVGIAPGAGGQRERPEDQGPRDRRGLRPAPPAVGGRAGRGGGARPAVRVGDRRRMS